MTTPARVAREPPGAGYRPIVHRARAGRRTGSARSGRVQARVILEQALGQALGFDPVRLPGHIRIAVAFTGHRHFPVTGPTDHIDRLATVSFRRARFGEPARRGAGVRSIAGQLDCPVQAGRRGLARPPRVEDAADQ